MQLLIRTATTGYDGWKTAFDDDSEDRSAAGLTLLQLWRDATQPDTVWALFDVSDRARAASHLKVSAALNRDHTTSTDHHFVKTA